MRRRMILLIAAMLAITTVIVSPALAHDDGGGTYLALGDSIAAGTQQPLPFTDNGYTNVLYDGLADEYGFDAFVNLGCPGDDTREFISGVDGPNGGSLCYGSGSLPPGGPSQLQAALGYLASNPGEVRLITITMGANDIFRCDFSDPEVNDCLESEIGLMATNLVTILATLRAAAPGVPIVGMNYYNANLGLWPVDPEAAAASQALVRPFNGTIESVYAAFGVPVADVETAFKTFETDGDVPTNVRAICKYTRMCEKRGDSYVLSDYDRVAPGPQTDIHPTNTGYHRIADTYSDLIEHLGLLSDGA
ncbi:MAG: SGNH/GDSL hydrolase family protein [Acidimicrobiia bacterium]